LRELRLEREGELSEKRKGVFWRIEGRGEGEKRYSRMRESQGWKQKTQAEIELSNEAFSPQFHFSLQVCAKS